MVALQISSKIESLYGLSDRRQNYKGLYGILQLLQSSHLDNFPVKTLKLGWVAFHSLTFQSKCLHFQSNRYKKLAPVLSRFCNGLLFSSCGGNSVVLKILRLQIVKNFSPVKD